MGVPALFRWLSRKYPKIVSQVIEEPDININGVSYPADYTRPNPNGELDNLYLDMNGIVHPCSHPENRPPPASEDEMMLEIFKYTDRVLGMARPRKILMIAVDGVAPRAKMNQQRSRRFRSAKDAKDKEEQNSRILEEMEALGKIIDDSLKGKRSWDTNVITPGTPFMDLLALSIRYWTTFKLNNDPGWKNVKVIISDATVPGEGEHKIMEFIRSQRQSPYYNPNTSHAIYGLDADLIMLGLATHELHFKVLREDVFFQDRQPRSCQICGQTGHQTSQCTGQAKIKNGEFDEIGTPAPTKKPFIWLHVSILREYLEQELLITRLPFKFDLERAIDDWVFMCFFVGNDFLPHIPSLEIRENGIDILINIWKRNLAQMGDYLTTDGTVNLKSTQYLLRGLGAQEDQIFRRRREFEVRRIENQKRRKLENGGNSNNMPGAFPVVKRNQVDIGPKSLPSDIPLFTPKGVAVGDSSDEGLEGTVKTITSISSASAIANTANKSAASFLKAQILARNSSEDSKAATLSTDDTSSVETALVVGNDPSRETSTPRKRKYDVDEASISTEEEAHTEVTATKAIPIDEDESKPEDDDTVRLWEPGYRKRYYEQKFHARSEDDAENIRQDVVKSYIEGVSWVLLYYYQGCPSWNWFYPYHYAPFAADFINIEEVEVSFNLGVPFRPYEQLMGVLPAASSHTLPPVLRTLMTDETSEIIDFYPESFPIDMNGKKMSWQGIALLPFIDEKRLLSAVQEKYNLLTEEEQSRNMHGNDVVYVSSESRFGEFLTNKFYDKNTAVNGKVALHSKISDGLIGYISRNPNYRPKAIAKFPITLSEELRQGVGGIYGDIVEDTSVNVIYIMPKSKYTHKSMLLPGAKPSPRVVSSLGGSNGGVPYDRHDRHDYQSGHNNGSTYNSGSRSNNYDNGPRGLGHYGGHQAAFNRGGSRGGSRGSRRYY
ncbi:exoribonuclease 2 [Dipodascopsis uninucleata]